MAKMTKNLAGLFGDSKIRIIFIFTGMLVLIGIIVGIIEFKARTAVTPTESKVGSVPSGIESVPGGFDTATTAEYARLQEQQNIMQSQEAERAGTSAIPTIIRAAKIGEGSAPAPTPASGSPWETGLGFGTLGRLQESEFTPKVIPTKECPKPGAGGVIYDKEGCLIGYATGDKSLRDQNGKMLGNVGPDGVVRDAEGKEVGKVALSALGTPVYDAQGRLIGYAGADGKVRDANGNVIGTVGVPGNIVRDASGKEVGKVGPAALGTPIYDANGRLIGYAGADGKVRDLNGNVIGTVGADGIVRDLSGKQIATVGEKPKPADLGTPLYDAQGRLIGYVGKDGKLRDANGNVIGSVDADGVIRNLNGEVIGSVGPDGTVRPVAAKVVEKAIALPAITALEGEGPSAAQTEAKLREIAQRQAAQLSAAQLDQTKQQVQGAMTSQANQLFSAWALVSTQQYVTGTPPIEEKGEAKARAGKGGTAGGAGGPVLLKAGTIMFAVLDTAVSSDEPGPILATVVEGQFKGSRLIGSLVKQEKKVMINFNVMSAPAYPRSITINAVAIDQNTARTGLSSYTNNHYLLRYGTLFASAFLQGYGEAFSTSGSATTSNGLSTTTTSPDLSPTGKFYIALGNVGNKWGAATTNNFNKPPTVYVFSGTALGILVLADVSAP